MLHTMISISLPALALIVLYSVVLGCHMILHGKPKDGNYSFWTCLAGISVELVLLWMGGFFS